MPKSISITWSEGVLEQESDVLVQTIDRTLKWLYFRHPTAFFDPPLPVRVYGNWVIPALVAERPYWGTQWYVNSSYDQRVHRVIAPTFLELVRQEPWQRANPHLDLALLDQDLTDFPSPLARLRPDHYCLGTSFPGRAAVMSVHRIRNLADPAVRELALARLVRHHLGHVLGIPQFARQEQVARLGLEMHCTNRCVMRHAATVEQLAALAVEEVDRGWPFCGHCTRGLHSIIVEQTQSWN